MIQAEDDNLANVPANQRSVPHSRTGSKPHASGIGEPAHPQEHPPKNLLDGVIKTPRLKQWMKNVLVITASLAVGNEIMGSGRSIDTLTVNILVAFVAFCMVASSTYLINDARDVEVDHAYPTKRSRPVAAGILPVSITYIMAVVLVTGSIVVSQPASEGPGLAIVVVVYITLQLGYCFGLKYQPVIGIALVPSSFMLRAVADGVATNVDLSQQLSLVAAFDPLSTTAGKRYTELLLVERTGEKARKSSQGYTATYLRFVQTLAATVVVLSYALQGFEMGCTSGTSSTSAIWYEISMVPFTVTILRFAVDVDHGDTGNPDEVALKDRPLQALAVL